MLRAVLFSLASVVLLTVYGQEVCPFLESLSYAGLARNLAAGFAVALVLRFVLGPRVLRAAAPEARLQAQFLLDLGVFALVGLALTVVHVVGWGFPAGSGMKLLVGCLLLGMLISLDLAMAEERRLVAVAETTPGLGIHPRQLRSVARLLGGASVVLLLLLMGVLVLVIKKDLDWMVTLKPDQMAYGQKAVLTEIVFVVAVVIILTANVVLQYARNLRLRFEHQTRVLDRVARGHLDELVPVAGRDELALIASRTNDMISELREKARIREVLGKVVSPEVAQRLLKGPNGIKLGGERRTLVILFSDLRNFTSFSEDRSPEEVVRVLNLYFGRVVRIIREQGGVVDKFMGDGILAVFGLDNDVAASDRAVLCALKMQQAVAQLGAELGLPLALGVGIHRGQVIAGNVGSPERLEFTFIGDAVNTASRLESATKAAGAPVIVSGDVLMDLGEKARALPWRGLGEVPLKGKSQGVPLHGLDESTWRAASPA